MSNTVIIATPTEEDFDPFGGCLDAQHAWKEFGGLSLNQAYEKFISHPLLYQEDFMFMGGRAFQFYFPVLDRYLRNYRVHVGPGDSEDSSAAIIAGGICTQLLSPTRIALNTILESIRELSGYVRSNLDLLAVDSDEQQWIDSYWQILDAQMNS